MKLSNWEIAHKLARQGEMLRADVNQLLANIRSA